MSRFLCGNESKTEGKDMKSNLKSGKDIHEFGRSQYLCVLIEAM